MEALIAGERSPLAPKITREFIAGLIVEEATKCVGIKEKGWNKGKEVEEFQKTVDGKAGGEAWCMCFVQTMARRVCDKLGVKKNPVYPSEHCQTVFVNTPQDFRSKLGHIGWAFIQKSYKDQTGHTGIQTSEIADRVFSTVEGNTDSGGGSEGDGVYSRKRSMEGTTTKYVRGFVDLPGLILQQYEKEHAPKGEANAVG